MIEAILQPGASTNFELEALYNAVVKARKDRRMVIELDDKHTFSSGASSSGMKPRYDLIPTWALRRIAQRFGEGAIKYGEDNWKKGLTDDVFIIDRINHATEHLQLMKDRVKAFKGIKTAAPVDVPDDDAAAVILNAIFVMGWEQKKGLF